MWFRFILLCFLLILLVSILFSVSNRFVCYFRLLKFALRKNRMNIVYPSDSIQQKRLPVWKLVEYTFNHYTYLCKSVCCESSKQTGNASQDRYKILSCWNNLFRAKQITCLRQADHKRRNSLLNRLFTKNCSARMETLFVSFLIYGIFHISPGLLLPKVGV